MSARRDPAEDLLRAWRGLEAPPAHRELADEDAVTQRAVDWMRAAWSAVEAPRVQSSELAPVAARPTAVQRAVALAVAAGVLALFVGLLRAVEPRAPGARVAAPAPPAASTPTARLAPDGTGLELRSGPVRLVLLRSDR